MDLYEKVVEYVDNSFGEKKPHFKRAVFWIEKFIPKVAEAHKIAAYAHDIERAFRDKNNTLPLSFRDEFFIKYHPEKGAEIIGEFLANHGADTETINKVKHLISGHEVGGDDEQNALMDADSVSWMETNAESFVLKRALVDGKEKIKEKLDWMFYRISSEERKEFARENYEKWLKILTFQ